MNQVNESESLEVCAKTLLARALNALIRHRWDGGTVVEEDGTSSGRTVRVTVEVVAGRPELRRPAAGSQVNGQAVTILDDSDIPTTPTGRGRKPGRCRADLVSLLDRRGSLKYAQIVAAVGDSHHENTIKESLKSLVISGAVLKGEGGIYLLPDVE